MHFLQPVGLDSQHICPPLGHAFSMMAIDSAEIAQLPTCPCESTTFPLASQVPPRNIRYGELTPVIVALTV